MARPTPALHEGRYYAVFEDDGRFFVRHQQTGTVYGRPAGWSRDRANQAAAQWEHDRRLKDATSPDHSSP